MASLVESQKLFGFFSYSRDDDQGSRGALSALRDAIQDELSAQLGRTQADFLVWHDKTAISHGTLWEDKISQGIDQAVFFIPIVTPRALRSQHCVFEFESFLAREVELGRDDLVFPILYIPVPELEDESLWRQDPVLKIVGKRQYLDWRDLRPRGLHEPEVQTKIIQFCRNISIALRKPWMPPGERKTAQRKAEVEQAFAAAKSADTVTAIDAFIASYPDSHLAADARSTKSRLLARDEAYGGAMASDDKGVLESFLYSYPNGPHADEIRERLRKLQLKVDDEKRRAEARERAEQEHAFATAKAADTVAAIDAFIASYPDSHLADDAGSAKAGLLARDEAHRRAMASDDSAVLKSFLKSYPTGSRADEVRDRLRRLEPPKVEDPPKAPKLDAARGFSKKKLMIAAAIAVIVIIGIYALSSSNSSSYTATQSAPVPNYSASAECTSKGIVGDGTGDTEEEAEDDAVNDCVANGGTRGCCRVQ
jgi:outer membrane protein assembly factor BamD (BamD/ComL family)